MPRSRFSRRRVLASLGATPVLSVLTRQAGAHPAEQQHEAARCDSPRTEAVLTAVLRVRLATPAEATVGSAIILGGETQGTLAGVVQPGSLEWTRDPVRGVLQLSTRFELQAGDGLRVHVADRATVTVASAACWESPFSTQPELTVVDGSPEACRQSVYLGRMDARQLSAGQLRLAVHRVL
jgi:hypothetical protein